MINLTGYCWVSTAEQVNGGLSDCAAEATTHRAIAQALNDRGVRTARGGDWHGGAIRNLLARAR
jgi:hypothetical protein